MTTPDKTQSAPNRQSKVWSRVLLAAWIIPGTAWFACGFAAMGLHFGRVEAVLTYGQIELIYGTPIGSPGLWLDATGLTEFGPEWSLLGEIYHLRGSTFIRVPIWPLALAAFIGWCWLHMSRRSVPALACPKCLYDMTGLARVGCIFVCPECGEKLAMREEGRTAPLPVRVVGRLDEGDRITIVILPDIPPPRGRVVFKVPKDQLPPPLREENAEFIAVFDSAGNILKIEEKPDS